MLFASSESQHLCSSLVSGVSDVYPVIIAGGWLVMLLEIAGKGLIQFGLQFDLYILHLEHTDIQLTSFLRRAQACLRWGGHLFRITVQRTRR